ncbi:MAG: hypothetical protein V4615_10035 [Bacteroidota bacterium]
MICISQTGALSVELPNNTLQAVSNIEQHEQEINRLKEIIDRQQIHMQQQQQFIDSLLAPVVNKKSKDFVAVKKLKSYKS